MRTRAEEYNNHFNDVYINQLVAIILSNLHKLQEIREGQNAWIHYLESNMACLMACLEDVIDDACDEEDDDEIIDEREDALALISEIDAALESVREAEIEDEEQAAGIDKEDAEAVYASCRFFQPSVTKYEETLVERLDTPEMTFSPQMVC